jgi:hypothetical protein
LIDFLMDFGIFLFSMFSILGRENSFPMKNRNGQRRTRRNHIERYFGIYLIQPKIVRCWLYINITNLLSALTPNVRSSHPIYVLHFTHCLVFFRTTMTRRQEKNPVVAKRAKNRLPKTRPTNLRFARCRRL